MSDLAATSADAAPDPDDGPVLVADFAGEMHELRPGGTLTIGRDGDIAIDDNPYLHRLFLEIGHADGLFWVTNLGARLPAVLSDVDGLMRSTLAPGSRCPVVFAETLLTFTAGSTAYEIELTTSAHEYEPQHLGADPDGETTIGPGQFTESQLLAILALAEPQLRRAGTGSAVVPTAKEAAARLGWPQTKFNRKLDNVCDKLDQAGVAGLRGGPGAAAANRRQTLVEYAVSTLLVTTDDLRVLDRAQPTRENDRERAGGAV